MRAGMQGAVGWRINRLADGMVGLEIVGSAVGYAVSLFALIGGLFLLVSGLPGGLLPYFAIVAGLVMAAISSFSTGHLIYRAALKRALSTAGVATRATVIDRWRLGSDAGAWSGVRLRFESITGPVEVIAVDSTRLVRTIGIGTTLPLRYDPADPRRVVIDAGPRP